MEKRLATLETFFKALADATRLRILGRLFHCRAIVRPGPCNSAAHFRGSVRKQLSHQRVLQRLIIGEACR